MMRFPLFSDILHIQWRKQSVDGFLKKIITLLSVASLNPAAQVKGGSCQFGAFPSADRSLFWRSALEQTLAEEWQLEAGRYQVRINHGAAAGRQWKTNTDKCLMSWVATRFWWRNVVPNWSWGDFTCIFIYLFIYLMTLGKHILSEILMFCFVVFFISHRHKIATLPFICSYYNHSNYPHMKPSSALWSPLYKVLGFFPPHFCFSPKEESL